MSMTENPQRERNQHDQANERAAQANRDRVRENGNRIAALADIAEENLEAADVERVGRSRYEDALQVLRWLVVADWHERTVDGDRVLHGEHGSLDAEKVGEFIDLILAGCSSLEARNTMRDAQKHAGHAEETRRAAAEARELAGGMHRYADGPLVPAQRPAAPALSAAPVPLNGVPQQRQPIAPPVPEFEHVDEPREWTTTQMSAVALAGEAKGELKPSTVQRLHDEGYGAQRKTAPPDMGPAAPAQFAASAVRIGDTQPMRMDEVLGHLAQADAGAEGDGKSMPPFPQAGTASRGSSDASSSAPSSGTSGDKQGGASDDDES